MYFNNLSIHSFEHLKNRYAKTVHVYIIYTFQLLSDIDNRIFMIF